jgi:hypothetical protein
VALPGTGTRLPLQEAMAEIMRARADTSGDLAK